MFEFTLIFNGRLSTQSHTKMKFSYRRYFLKQLKELREHLIADGAPESCNFKAEDRIVVGPFTFCPLVTKASRKVIDLDITLLSNCEPGCCKEHPTGDLDNYLKVLIDGLRMAQTMNEVRDEKPLSGEGPFYTLCEDDQQIKSINISHYRNYNAKEKGVRGKGSEIFALIKVKISEKYCL